MSHIEWRPKHLPSDVAIRLSKQLPTQVKKLSHIKLRHRSFIMMFYNCCYLHTYAALLHFRMQAYLDSQINNSNSIANGINEISILKTVL